MVFFSSAEVYSDQVLNAVGRDDTLVTYEDAEPFTTNIKTIDCSKAVKEDYCAKLEKIQKNAILKHFWVLKI